MSEGLREIVVSEHDAREPRASGSTSSRTAGCPARGRTRRRFRIAHEVARMRDLEHLGQRAHGHPGRIGRGQTHRPHPGLVDEARILAIIWLECVMRSFSRLRLSSNSNACPPESVQMSETRSSSICVMSPRRAAEAESRNCAVFGDHSSGSASETSAFSTTSSRQRSRS